LPHIINNAPAASGLTVCAPVLWRRKFPKNMMALRG
jgi:hypothetical protein